MFRHSNAARPKSQKGLPGVFLYPDRSILRARKLTHVSLAYISCAYVCARVYGAEKHESVYDVNKYRCNGVYIGVYGTGAREDRT